MVVPHNLVTLQIEPSWARPELLKRPNVDADCQSIH